MMALSRRYMMRIKAFVAFAALFPAGTAIDRRGSGIPRDVGDSENGRDVECGHFLVDVSIAVKKPTLLRESNRVRATNRSLRAWPGQVRHLRLRPTRFGSRMRVKHEWSSAKGAAAEIRILKPPRLEPGWLCSRITGADYIGG